MDQNRKRLIGAVIAAALAVAMYYGLIGQQAATNIQNQANQALGTAPASQQPSPSTVPNPAPPGAPAAPAPQPPPVQPQH